MNLFVAKMNRRTTPEDLKRLFEAFGEVLSVKIIQDRASGLSKGYGFIEMATDDAAELAIASLNETTFQEAVIVVKKANPREEPPPRRKPVLRKNVPGSPPDTDADPEVTPPETED